jgi:hypothetical protein
VLPVDPVPWGFAGNSWSSVRFGGVEFACFARLLRAGSVWLADQQVEVVDRLDRKIATYVCGDHAFNGL